MENHVCFFQRKFHSSPRKAVVKQGPKIFLKCNGLLGVPLLALEVLFVVFFVCCGLFVCFFFLFVFCFCFPLFAGWFGLVWLVWFVFFCSFCFLLFIWLVWFCVVCSSFTRHDLMKQGHSNDSDCRLSSWHAMIIVTSITLLCLNDCHQTKASS